MPNIRAFVHLGSPKSYNSPRLNPYKEAMRESFQSVYPRAELLGAEALYGIAYYFSARPADIDADNLSKPIWDALTGLAFVDDSSVELRHAGIFVANRNTAQDLQITHVPGHASGRIFELIGGRNDFVYVEIGRLTRSMFRFGLMGKHT